MTARFGRDLERRFARHTLRAALRPLFERALAAHDATARVAVNDAVAMEALRFLHERGVAVPRDMSVAGFDNTLESFFNGLTSWDFNIPALVGALLGHILGPRPSGRAAYGPVVEIEGFVAARQTVRAVR